MKFFLAIFILLISFSAFAQCPYGIPNNPGCVPPDAWSQNQSGGEYPVAGPRWLSRWGAIFIDYEFNGGAIGVSEGMNSKRAALSLAKKRCVISGGDKNRCKEASSYSNGCVALASGDGWFIPRHAPDSDSANEMAVIACKNKSNECKVIYQACSEAILKN